MIQSRFSIDYAKNTVFIFHCKNLDFKIEICRYEIREKVNKMLHDTAASSQNKTNLRETALDFIQLRTLIMGTILFL